MKLSIPEKFKERHELKVLPVIKESTLCPGGWDVRSLGWWYVDCDGQCRRETVKTIYSVARDAERFRRKKTGYYSGSGLDEEDNDHS